MSGLRRALARLLSSTRHAADDRELQEELAEHLALLEEEYLRQGVAAGEARRLARLKLGSVADLREAHRDARGAPLLDGLVRDLRAAIRSLRRDAAVSLAALAIVGLGIGASVTVFSVVNTLLIRPLPFAAADRLVWIANGTSDNLSAQTTQVDNLLGLQAGSRLLEDIAAFSPFYGVGDVRLTGDVVPARLTEVRVTENFFPLLGVAPLRGRFFAPEEARFGAEKTVVLSYEFWSRQFGADPSVVGRSLLLDGRAATVIGILPPTFDFGATFTPGRPVDFFVPFPLSPETNRTGNSLALIARLASGVTLEQAAAETSAIAGAFPSGRMSDHWRNVLRPRVLPLRSRVAGGVRFGVSVVAGAVAFLLLLICANISGLLLAKGATRRREMAVRSALGASRRQLVRQLLVESVILAAVGAALGIVIASGAIRTIAGLEGTAIPLLSSVRLDRATLWFAVAATAITALGTGLLPAMQVSATAPALALGDGARGSTRAGGRLRRALVVAEVAVVAVLLTGGGLLARSLAKVLDVEPGFEPAGLVAVRVDPERSIRTLEQRTAYFDAVLGQVRAVPGVEAAGLTDALPFGNNFGWRRWNVNLPGRDDDDQGLEPLIRIVDPGFFATMRIGLVAGRPFAEGDDASAERVAIVNEALAEALWPGRDPLGQTLRTSGFEARVVGLVREARYFSLERSSGPELYLPIRQTSDAAVVDLVVRTAEGGGSIGPAIMAALGRVDRDLPRMTVREMTTLIDQAVFERRSVALLVLGFAGFGLLLAALGLYAVIAYSVQQRRQEIAVRLALGATPADVERLVLRETVALVALGTAVGVPGAWLVSKAIRGLLYGVTATDPLTVVAVLAILAAVAVAAGLLPARRAARTEALTALQAS